MAACPENKPVLWEDPMGDTASASGGQQHLLALERANRVRLARAELKRQIAGEEISASQVILDCPWEAASMSISDLLMCQRRWGRARCRRLLISLGVPENKQIGTLTQRQRLALAAVLGVRGRPSVDVAASSRTSARHEALVA
jgi:hypothetical protein